MSHVVGTSLGIQLKKSWSASVSIIEFLEQQDMKQHDQTNISFTGTHCLEPPVPYSDIGVEAHGWDGDIIEVGAKIQFQCTNEMKVEGDKNILFQEVTCQENNTFAEPAWNKCVESKHMCWHSFLVYIISLCISCLLSSTSGANCGDMGCLCSPGTWRNILPKMFDRNISTNLSIGQCHTN